MVMIVERAVRISSKATNLHPVIFFPDAVTSKVKCYGFCLFGQVFVPVWGRTEPYKKFQARNPLAR